MVHHDLEISLLRQINKFFRLLRAARKRFLDEYMFSMFQARLCELIVRPYRSDNGDSIDIRRSYQPRDVGVPSNLRMSLMKTSVCRFTLVANSCNRAVFQ